MLLMLYLCKYHRVCGSAATSPLWIHLKIAAAWFWTTIHDLAIAVIVNIRKWTICWYYSERCWNDYVEPLSICSAFFTTHLIQWRHSNSRGRPSAGWGLRDACHLPVGSGFRSWEAGPFWSLGVAKRLGMSLAHADLSRTFQGLKLQELGLETDESSPQEGPGALHPNWQGIQSQVPSSQPQLDNPTQITGVGKCPILGILDITWKCSHEKDHIYT